MATTHNATIAKMVPGTVVKVNGWAGTVTKVGIAGFDLVGKRGAARWVVRNVHNDALFFGGARRGGELVETIEIVEG